MPPPSYGSMTRYSSLAAAHYNFYKAPISWALLLLGDDEQRNKLMADFYLYEALRHAASHTFFNMVIIITIANTTLGAFPPLYHLLRCSDTIGR
ncbi:hypothetical protein B0I35DRAFT_484464 [Stachybotrys elegans]|uniref:Uncharacterized protein n=1 Tax=Stachybotrys elegans TaxID=80388 RepID=A0A8K0SA20_9HYPO|nr:hypothetical protein B0I35DRAFT_484464 [Stachybotrys elegans]